MRHVTAKSTLSNLNRGKGWKWPPQGEETMPGPTGEANATPGAHKTGRNRRKGKAPGKPEREEKKRRRSGARGGGRARPRRERMPRRPPPSRTPTPLLCSAPLGSADLPPWPVSSRPQGGRSSSAFVRSPRPSSFSGPRSLRSGTDSPRAPFLSVEVEP